jgi:hypothetical protein
MAHVFSGARRMKPTQKHRIAIFENMLATVYAVNDAGVLKYFDYDWDGARAWAGVDEDGRDPRVFKQSHAVTVGRGRETTTVSKGRIVLYIKRPAK